LITSGKQEKGEAKMGRIEGLLKAYEEFVSQPWPAHLSGPEKVWFAVYEPAQERRLSFRIPEFATATAKAGHGWVHVEIGSFFAEWMAGHKYRDAYFEDPEALELALTDFATAAAAKVQAALTAPEVRESTVVALSGVGALFGLTKTSDILGQVTPHIRGRLLVFFPGRYESSQYRLLDARDGWDYLAVPILARNGD
jgi:hypothetical protein